MLFSACFYSTFVNLSLFPSGQFFKPAQRNGKSFGYDGNDNAEQTPAERHAAVTWAQRLKHVFDIDIA